ncbi:hypothetical protein M9458_015010, partial [Cirrhinus mrigala]
RNEKHNVYSQYLYKQLQNVERELRLLEPSSFSKPDSYNQAVLQVQGMKNLLEPHVSSCSVSGLHTRSSSPIEGSSGNSKKCCQKGLPWWFVFIGCILHYDVWVDLWEGALHQLAHLNGGVILRKPLHHPACK